MKLVIVTLNSVFILFSSASSIAEDEDWQHEITPYFWASSLTTELRTGEFTADGSLEFSEVLDKLEVGLMGQYETRRGSWSFYADVLYFNLADDSQPLPGTTLDVDITQSFAMAMVGYKPADIDVLDLYIGLRYDNLKTELDFSGLINERGSSESMSWVDPVIGVRARYPINEDWTLDMSVFYSTGTADHTASGTIGLRWQFGEKWSSTFSYRYSEIDYDDEIGFKEDSYGPMVAFGYRF